MNHAFINLYFNEDVYEIEKPPTCILFDVALAECGPKAIAESFYNSLHRSAAVRWSSERSSGMTYKGKLVLALC